MMLAMNMLRLYVNNDLKNWEHGFLMLICKLGIVWKSNLYLLLKLYYENYKGY